MPEPEETTEPKGRMSGWSPGGIAAALVLVFGSNAGTNMLQGFVQSEAQTEAVVDTVETQGGILVAVVGQYEEKVQDLEDEIDELTEELGLCGEDWSE